MYKRGNSWYSDFHWNGRRHRKSWGDIPKKLAEEKEGAWKINIKGPGYKVTYPKRNEPDTIYLLFDTTNKLTKIGIANNVDRRIRKDIKAMNPSELILIATFFACYRGTEHMLQESFYEERVNGEWFELNFCQIIKIIEYFENKNKLVQVKLQKYKQRFHLNSARIAARLHILGHEENSFGDTTRSIPNKKNCNMLELIR